MMNPKPTDAELMKLSKKELIEVINKLDEQARSYYIAFLSYRHSLTIEIQNGSVYEMIEEFIEEQPTVEVAKEKSSSQVEVT